MYDYFSALTYVTDTEERGIFKMYDWEEMRFEGDDQLYLVTSFERDGDVLRTCAARQDRMGAVAASVLSMKIVQHFHPQYLIVPGLAAGLGERSPDGMMEGDILLGSAVWDYASGKITYVSESDISYFGAGFIPRPHRIELDEDLRECISDASMQYPHEFHVHVGPIATGCMVVANSDYAQQFVLDQNADSVGIDMEAYGVAYAAAHVIEPRPKVIICKGICDFANHEKTIAIKHLRHTTAACLPNCSMSATFLAATSFDKLQ